MAKTLNQFLEGYLKVKNPDEQKFVDKHVVAKHADRNGNDDEVFKGSKVKPIDRRKDRKGYNPGEDEKVYEELKGGQHKIDANKNGKVDAHDFKLLRKKKKVAEEVEELEELSTATLQGYRKKARAQGNAIVDKMKMGGGDWSKDQKDTKTLRKRSSGAQMSGKQLVKRGESLKTEEAEQVEESAMFGKRVHNIAKHYGFSHDGKNSSAHGKTSDSISHFNGGSHWGHSDKSGRTIATGSSKDDSLSKHLEKHGYKLKEEAEQIDELSNDTLRSYRMKAKSIADHGGKQRTQGRELAGRKSYGGRMAGIEKAKVMAKEENQIDEISKGTAMKALQHVSSDPDDVRGYTLQKKIAKKWPGMKDHAADASYTAAYGRSNRDIFQGRDKLADRAKTSYRMTKDGKANKQDLKARFRKEEIEELDEKLNMDKASMGTVVKDFQKSDAPQFKGKSQDKRRAMAIAAKLTAERGGKPLRKEEKLTDLLGDLTETHRRTMLSVFDKLNEDNQKKFLEACETPDGVESMLDFSISHRGE